jgi:hypothetical protein
LTKPDNIFRTFQQALDTRTPLNLARSPQARGKFQEAGSDVRRLLDFLRDNRASVQALLLPCQDLLFQASVHLKILDPVLGDQALVKSVADEAANLRSG